MVLCLLVMYTALPWLRGSGSRPQHCSISGQNIVSTKIKPVAHVCRCIILGPFVRSPLRLRDWSFIASPGGGGGGGLRFSRWSKDWTLHPMQIRSEQKNSQPPPHPVAWLLLLILGARLGYLATKRVVKGVLITFHEEKNRPFHGQ